MDRRELYGLLGGFGVFVALFVVGWVTGWWPVSELLAWVGEAAVGVAAGFLIWGFAPRARRWASRHGVPNEEATRQGQGSHGVVPTIRIEPLPYYKGHDRYVSEAGSAGDRSGLPDQTHVRKTTTHTEAWQLEESQIWYRGRITHKGLDYGNRYTWKRAIDKPEFLAKFGVVRIFASGAPAIDCIASGKAKTLKDPSGIHSDDRGRNMGPLDWFDMRLKIRFLKSRHRTRKVKSNPATTAITEYVHNPKVTINDGGYADLPIFYTLDSYPAVLLWSKHPGLSAGRFDGNRQVKFEVHLKLEGFNFTSIEQTLLVTGAPDDFSLTRVR